MGDLFQKFLNRLNRGYGQVDKNVFGGLLPGGAATPIGAAFQRSGLPKNQQPTDFDRRKAALIDAAATGIAKAQPVVERTLQAAPPVVQQTVSKGLNALPFSANLFGRYYTGIGAAGLEIPEAMTKQVGTVIAKPEYLQRILTNSIEEEKSLSDILNSPSAAGMDMPTVRKFANDALAETRSRIKRMRAGDIPYTPYETQGQGQGNPLTSTSTSFGNVWFSPSKGGYTANEKYDFVYGAADKKVPMTQLPGGIAPLDPSQEAALTSALGMQGPKGIIPIASSHPLTFFGRSIVMKMPDKSFTYPINIR
jgi:hypothetical protein